jgi:hypothetical protein
LIEAGRSRALSERLSLGPSQDLRTIQSRVPANSVLLDFWTGPDSIAIVWITSSQAGVVRHSGGIQESAAKLIAALQSCDNRWRDLSRALGSALLSGIPLPQHLIVVPDGPLTAIPFEALTEPGSNTLVIERSDLSHLPSAQFLSLAQPAPERRLPWHRQLVAFGDPPVGNADALAEGWQRLPASADEVRSIQQILPGRTQAYLGPDAQKRYLAGNALEDLPILHFSTHAMVDPDNPDHSRILLASDYLLQREVFIVRSRNSRISDPI